jgi:lysophospholipase L1-like esterase
MGTSLTAGTGFDPANPTLVYGSFTPVLTAAFPAKSAHTRTYNVATGGVNSDYGLSKHLPIVMGLRPRAVLIEYMMNDCTGAGAGGTTTAGSTSNYNAIIDALQTLPVVPAIYLLVMNPTVGSGSGATARANLSTYNALLPGIAGAQGAGVSVITPAWGTLTATDVPDGVHPTLICNGTKLIPALVSGLGSSIT